MNPDHDADGTHDVGESHGPSPRHDGVVSFVEKTTAWNASPGHLIRLAISQSVEVVFINRCRRSIPNVEKLTDIVQSRFRGLLHRS